MERSYAPHASLLLSVKPHVRNILIPYNASEQWLKDDIASFAHAFKPHDVTLHSVPIEDADSLLSTVRKQISDVDTLLMLRDNLTLTKVDELVTLCNEHGVTLFASDLYSVEKGAAIGIGTDQTVVGQEAAARARQILENKIAPSRIPVVRPSSGLTVRINHETMLNQGLAIPVISDSSFS